MTRISGLLAHAKSCLVLQSLADHCWSLRFHMPSPRTVQAACSRQLGSPTLAAVVSASTLQSPGCHVVPDRQYPANASAAWTAVTTILTSQTQLERFACYGNFRTWEAHLMSDTIVPIIFYPKAEPYFKAHTSWPVHALGLHLCDTDAKVDGCERWTTARGQGHVLTCAIDMEVPIHYGGNLFAARATKPAAFCGRGLFNGEYVVANKWYTFPMFREPVLRRFDFWAKFDVDVCFRRAVTDFDVIGPLVAQRAVFFHAKLMVDNPVCEANLGDLMQLFFGSFRAKACGDAREPPWKAWGSPYEHPPVSFGSAATQATRTNTQLATTPSQHRQPPTSSTHAGVRGIRGSTQPTPSGTMDHALHGLSLMTDLVEPCGVLVPSCWAGNFIGGWLGFWQSPAVMHFARLWWEWEGGWTRRWGDQQYWMPALWMFGRNDSSGVADLTRLRYSMFRHSKDMNACGGNSDERTAAFCHGLGASPPS